MRPLSEHPYPRRYDSNSNKSILKEFYIPTLSNSVEYWRVASYFRSSAFLANAPGLAKFINNGGKIKLIVNVKLDKNDYDAIQAGEKNENEFIENYFSTEVEELKISISKKRYKFLSWLIATGRLEIRVGYVKKNIEHAKYGIFFDEEGNKVSFNGSINESITGWTTQSNRFKVFTSWTDRKDDLEDDISDFEKLWENKGIKTTIYKFPDAVKKGFFDDLENDLEDESAVKRLIEYLELEDDEELNDVLKENPLWLFQDKAIQAWKENNRVGLLEMATGTGKTYTAMHGLIGLQREKESLLTIIICHSKDLCKQWAKELKKFGIKPETTVGNSRWSVLLEDIIADIIIGGSKYPVIITTYGIYSDDEFIHIIQEERDLEKFIICDEAHNAASEQSINGLIDDYKYRLALTATPYGYFDDLGYADRMMQYFGCTVNEEGNLTSTFIYDLADAISAKWADEPALVNYEYILHPVDLEEDEMEEYKKLTSRLTWKTNDKNKMNNRLREQYIFDRAELIKSARGKIPLLKQILADMDAIELLLIYHSPENQKVEVYHTLDELGLTWSRFTGEEPDREREALLLQIATKQIQALAAMKCLDQGVDVPAIKNAIILSSSGNPMTFIQRRGRVLRKSPGKDRAIIHDFIVLPPLLNEDNSSLMERGIIKKELRRINEFSKLSLYNTEVNSIIRDIAKRYKIDLREE